MGRLARKLARKDKAKARKAKAAAKPDLSASYKAALSGLAGTEIIRSADPAVLRSRLEQLWRNRVAITQSRAEDAAVCPAEDWPELLSELKAN